MKIILSSKRHHYLTRVSIILVAVALIAVMVGCGPAQYSLTISSTPGGTVTTPGEGLFSYDKETVVNLVATPNAGYHFAHWTGNVDTVADAYAATTTITVNNRYYLIASFER
jgi:hypothetical protein